MYPNDNPEYAKQRLVGTIITHNGKAVNVANVRKVGGNKPLEVSSIAILNHEPVIDSIENYDLTPIKLGFVNHGADTVYVTRMPMREDWRQGFRWSQAFFPFMSTPDTNVDSIDLARSVENIFPDIDEIREILRRRQGMMAWCRNFAIDNKDQIFYRGFGKVGEFLDKTTNFLLDGKFFWVEDRLKKVL